MPVRRIRDEAELAQLRQARQIKTRGQTEQDEQAETQAYFVESIIHEFAAHADRLRQSARQRREAVQLRNVVADKEMQEAVSVEDTLGKRQPQDEYQGDINLRTLRTLLGIVDQRGFERSPHQMKFHSAFERAAARVVYRSDWETQRPAIMRKNKWKTCPGEVMISTPRRFGKTFRRPEPAFRAPSPLTP